MDEGIVHGFAIRLFAFFAEWADFHLSFRKGNYRIFQSSTTTSFTWSGVGAVMVSDFLVKNSPEDAENLLYIVLKSPHSHRTLYIVKKKDTPLSPIAEEFVAEALALCSAK